MEYGIELECDAESDNGLGDEPVPIFYSEDDEKEDDVLDSPENIIETEETVHKDGIVAEASVSDHEHQSTDYQSDDVAVEFPTNDPEGDNTTDTLNPNTTTLGDQAGFTGIPTDFV